MFERLDRISLSLLDDNNLSSRATVAAFVGCSLVLLGFVLLMGPYPVTLFPMDVGYAIAQGDYLTRGFRPYVDYFSFHGPFPALFTALGIEVHGISLKAIVLSQVAGAAVMGTLMWIVARRRLPWFWALLLPLCVELLLVSYSPLGRRSWREYSPAMWYNACGFSLCATIFLSMLLPARPSGKVSRLLDSAAVGLCLASLFHTKMSFFGPVVVAFVIGGLAWPRGRQMRVDAAAALGLSAAFAFAIMWSLGGSIEGYFEFLGRVEMRVHPLAFALRSVHFTRTISLFLVALLLAAMLARESSLLGRLNREWFMAAMILGAMLVITGTCKQDPESLPLLGIVPLAIGVALSRFSHESGSGVNPHLAAPLVLAALALLAVDAKNSALSLALARVNVKTFDPPVDHLASADSLARQTAISSRVDPALFTLMPRDWTENTLEALALLKRGGVSAGETLFVSTDANGITAFTDLKPTHGEAPWVSFAFADSPTDVPPNVDNFLADADWILRDLGAKACWEHIEHFRGEFVRENFKEVAASERWSLYRRVKDEGAAAAPAQGEP